MKVKEFIEEINNKNLSALCYVDDIVFLDHEDDVELIQKGLNLEQNDHYSLATNIYKLEDGFVGVEGVFQSFDYYSDWEDYDTTCAAYEVIEVPTVTYISKNGKEYKEISK